VFRLPALAEVEDLEIPLQSGGGTVLRVVVFDADSPPLEDLSFSALVRRTALVLALPGPRVRNPPPPCSLAAAGRGSRSTTSSP